MQHKLVKHLIQQFSKLPRINSRQAQKITSHLLEELAAGMLDARNFISALDKAKSTISNCEICSNIIFAEEECTVCKQFVRKQFDTICVVENLHELWRMESLHNINFTFHVLGGIISATNGTSPDMLNVDNLIRRIEEHQITEVIVALNKSYSAIITSNYLAELLRRRFPNLRISTLAGGLPSGADLDFIDDRTLEIAIESRVLCN